MKKKVSAIALSVIALCSLCACGSKTVTNENKEEITPTPTPEPVSTIVQDGEFIVTREEFLEKYQETLIANLGNDATVELKESGTESMYDIYVNSEDTKVQLVFGDEADPIQEGEVIGNKVKINLMVYDADKEFFEQISACMVTMITPSLDYDESLDTTKSIITGSSTKNIDGVSYAYLPIMSGQGTKMGLGSFTTTLTESVSTTTTSTSSATKSDAIEVINNAAKETGNDKGKGGVTMRGEEYKDGVAMVVSMDDLTLSSAIVFSSTNAGIDLSNDLIGSCKPLISDVREATEKTSNKKVDFPIYLRLIASDTEDVDLIIIRDDEVIFNVFVED